MSEFKLGKYWLKLRGSKYYFYWYDNKKKRTPRRSTGTSDFQTAQRILAEYAIRNEQIRDQDVREMPLSTVLVRYYDNHAKHLRSAETSRNALRKWTEHYQGCMVSDLTPERQKRFIDALKKDGYANEYINRILTTGRAALNYAYQNQEITSTPFIRLLPAGIPRERVMTITEAAALFNACTEPHIQMYLMLAFNTLARPEALLELTAFQIDYERRLINLNPPGREQTKKRRPTVPITKTLMPWLLNPEHSYFVEWRGKPVRSIKTSWRRLRAEAGVPMDVVPYTIRHTMATELRKRDVPPWEIAGFLGHRSGGYTTTERYAKFAPDYLMKATAAIDDYFEALQQLVGVELVKKMRLVK